MEIPADDLIYIGKEANKIEDQPLDAIWAQVFTNEEEIKQKIWALTPEEARKKGIKHRSTLKRIKDKIKHDKELNYEKGMVKVLVEKM